MAWTSNPSHFRVFRFLFGRGTDVHLPSQENEIQPISQQPTSEQMHAALSFNHKPPKGTVPFGGLIVSLVQLGTVPSCTSL